MEILLLGITLLVIILIALLCNPIDKTNEEVLLQSNKGEIAADHSRK